MRVSLGQLFLLILVGFLLFTDVSEIRKKLKFYFKNKKLRQENLNSERCKKKRV